MIIEDLFPSNIFSVVHFSLICFLFSGQNRGKPAFKVKKVSAQDQGTRLQCLSCKNRDPYENCSSFLRTIACFLFCSPCTPGTHYLVQFTTVNLIQSTGADNEWKSIPLANVIQPSHINFLSPYLHNEKHCSQTRTLCLSVSFEFFLSLRSFFGLLFLLSHTHVLSFFARYLSFSQTAIGIYVHPSLQVQVTSVQHC